MKPAAGAPVGGGGTMGVGSGQSYCDVARGRIVEGAFSAMPDKDENVILSPKDLLTISYEAEEKELREILEKKRKKEEAELELLDSFKAREVRPDAAARVMKVVKVAAQQGKREVLALTFPSSFCSDGGRAINNFEPDWPKTLEGFPKRGHAWFVETLQPRGFKLKAQIINFPNGMPGDVGIYICW